jgi:GT2 family glycosyltransferase/lipopolysaccharide/colanic/teichoic acid biosynthesis glycosyltransferase
MKCSVVIVSHNSRESLYPCLTTLQRFPPSASWEAIVVDNASTDGTPEMVSARFPAVRLVTNAANLGYSRAVNQGMRLAKGEYFLVLNPDVTTREGSLQNLLDFAESHPEGGLFGARLLHPDGRLQYSCRSFYTVKVLLLRRTPLGRLFPNSRALREHLMLDYDHLTPRAVDWVLGACMLVRRKVVESVGFMDERFFLYFEDVDWCYRIQRAGWKVFYVPEAVMEHQHVRASAASPFHRPLWAHLMSLMRYYEKWNRVFYFFKRYRKVFQIAAFLLADLVAVNGAFLSSWHLRLRLDRFFPHGLYSLDMYGTFWIYLNLVMVVTFFWMGLYRIHRGQSVLDEWLRTARGFLMVTVLMMAATYVSHTRIYSRAVVALFFPLAVLYGGTLRSALRLLHRRLLAQKLDLKRTVIVGDPERVQNLVSELEGDPALGVDVVGIVASGPDERRVALGRMEDLGTIVEDYRVEEVIFTPGSAGQERIAEFVTSSRNRALDVKVLTDLSDILVRRASLSEIAGRPALHVGRESLHAANRWSKRVLDVALAAGFLVVSCAGAVVYWLRAAPAGRFRLDTVQRLGRGRRPFTIREIRRGAAGGRLGDLFQPHLYLSVLAGRMSLVGPYPVSPEEAEASRGLLEIRFHLRPGVTGPWRLIPPDERVPQLRTQDLFYIQSWSLGRDLKTLLESLSAMARGD